METAQEFLAALKSSRELQILAPSMISYKVPAPPTSRAPPEAGFWVQKHCFVSVNQG